MTSPTPQSLPADGNVKVLFVLAIANPEAPTVTELTAGTVLDLTCYLTPTGYQPATDEAVINDDRLCSRDTFEKRGRRTNTLQTMYVGRTQDAAGTDNKAYTTLKEGTKGFFVERWGQDYEDPIVATDIVNVRPVELGVQIEMQPEANSVLKFSQKQFITGPVVRQVPVVAGA